MESSDFYAMTDAAIAAELGRRMEQLRLEANIPQKVIAAELGISLGTYRSAVKGRARLQVIIGVLRLLGKLENLNEFLPDAPYSPIELLKLEGKKRQRAGTSRSSAKRGAADDASGENLDW